MTNHRIAQQIKTGQITVILIPALIGLIMILNGVASAQESFKRDTNNQSGDNHHRRLLDNKPVNADCSDSGFWHGVAKTCVECSEVCTSRSKRKASCYEQSLFCVHNCPKVFFGNTVIGDCLSPELFRYKGFECCLNCIEFCSQLRSSDVTDCLKLCPVRPMSRDECGVDEMYHPVSKTCVPCRLICAPGRSTIYCSRNCPNYRRKQQEEGLSGPCGLNEFYHPLNGTCVPCGLICRSNTDNRSRNYCNQNCPGYNVSGNNEMETTKSAEPHRHRNGKRRGNL